MKKTILTTIVFILTITMSFSQSKSVETDASFGVRGNCGMCKTTIEKAANNIDGVSKAIWDKENKKIDVSYDASKTSLDEIHNAIAASGYDTDIVKTNSESYNSLPGCCQYDKEMEMSIEAISKDENKGKEYTSAYICPMHCEGSGSDKEGKCPTCGMNYVKNKDYKGENNHEGHNH